MIMLNAESKKLIIEKIKYFETSGIEPENLIGDKHFLSELTMSLMVMETEGINSSGSFPVLHKAVKEFVRNYVTGNVKEV
jgi:hypothetical protein